MYNMINQSSAHTIYTLFPTPVYIVKRDLELSPKDDKDIEDIIEEGLYKNYGNATTINSYIFNTKLKALKQFCEQQLKIYVEKVINPKEKLDFYITQSWLNVTKPGETHHIHHHPNSIISGVFYISTEEDDTITFLDPNVKIKKIIELAAKEYNQWNSSNWFFPVENNVLILFPSWLEHKVESNEKATTDRISISFNTFVRGTLGKRNDLTELILE